MGDETNGETWAQEERPWQRQINLLRAYASFYNPVNLIRTLLALRTDSVSTKRLLFQIIGHIGLVMTIPKMLLWARRLKRGPIEVWDGLQPARIPMIDAATGTEINWAINRPPTHNLPQRAETSSTTLGTRAPSQHAPATEVAC